jgi:hypothetical protein
MTIRLVRLATFANIGQINPLFDQVFDDEQWFLSLIEKEGDQLPSQIKSQFYLSMAQAYFFIDTEAGREKIQNYLALFQTMPDKEASSLEQFSKMKVDLISVLNADRGAA